MVIFLIRQIKAHNRQLAGDFMGSLWHKPNENRNVKNILKTKSVFPHLVAFDYDSALHYKTFEHVSRVSRERDEILTT